MLPKNFRPVLSFILILMLGTIYLPAIGLAQGDTWGSKTPMISDGRANTASCELDGKIYVMGGLTESSYPYAVKTVEIFDPQSDSWTAGIDLPAARSGASACALSGKIYLIGGRTGDLNNVHQREVFEFDPVTQNWTTKTWLPKAKSFFCAFVVDGKIYTMGGRTNYDVSPQDVAVYDPVTDVWITKTPMPENRNAFGAAMVNGKIYVIGGEKGFNKIALKTVWEYDTMTDTWTRKTDMPTARMNLAAEAVNGMIYVMGGGAVMGGVPQYLKVNEEYDPVTDSWTKRADLLTPRGAGCSGVIDNKIYVIGGATKFVNATYPNPPARLTTSVEEYVPPVKAPYIACQSHILDDSQGNNNGRANAGETVNLIVTLRNIRFDTTNVTATISSQDQDVQIIQANADFGAMGRDQTASNQNSPFTFSVTASSAAHPSTFDLTISWEGGKTHIDKIEMVIGNSSILMVDDDCGCPYETHFIEITDKLKIYPDPWCVSAKGCPHDALQQYQSVIWFTGDDGETALSAEEQTAIANYLNNGGRLLITGQNIGDHLVKNGSKSDSTFYANYLHAQLVADSTQPTMILGVSGDPISNGLFINFSDYFGGAGNQDTPDIIAASSDAKIILKYSPGMGGAALCHEDPATNSRLVYLAFGFEGIGGPHEDSAEKLMTNVLTWLQETTGVHQLPDSRLPNDFVLEQNYPNPFNPTTTINYSIAKDSHVKLMVYNTLGQVVAVLVDGYQVKGSYNVKWEAINQPSGIYLYKLEAGEFTASKKMFLQK